MDRIKLQLTSIYPRHGYLARNSKFPSSMLFETSRYRRWASLGKFSNVLSQQFLIARHLRLRNLHQKIQHSDLVIFGMTSPWIVQVVSSSGAPLRFSASSRRRFSNSPTSLSSFIISSDSPLKRLTPAWREKSSHSLLQFNKVLYQKLERKYNGGNFETLAVSCPWMPKMSYRWLFGIEGRRVEICDRLRDGHLIMSKLIDCIRHSLLIKSTNAKVQQIKRQKNEQPHD